MDPYLWGTAWALVTIIVVSQGQKDSEEDEKRPYKFAFAIEGYQHRSEEKDERGIIMGEFGFVTGDGVYHVTVYATDENGNFKILKMKNYYIGLPGEGTTAAPSRVPPPTTRATTPPPPPTTKSPIQLHLQGLMGCSGCIVPDRSSNGKTPGGAGRPPSSSEYGEGLLDERFGGGDDTPKKPGSPSVSPGKPGFGVGKPAYNEKPPGGSKQTFGAPGGSRPGSGFPGAQRPSTGSQPVGGPQYNTPAGNPAQQKPGGVGFARPPSPSGGASPGFGSDRFGETPSVQGGPPSQNTGSGSLPGSSQPPKAGSPTYSGKLPPGMSMEDLMALLYKFNYTLKYHGHHESGYRNGDKEGGYFFNGGDGLGRNVNYIANEFGFQPNITLVDLGLSSPDVPKAQNEEPNELKGYEFKWFYNR